MSHMTPLLIQNHSGKMHHLELAVLYLRKYNLLGMLNPLELAGIQVDLARFASTCENFVSFAPACGQLTGGAVVADI